MTDDVREHHAHARAMILATKMLTTARSMTDLDGRCNTLLPAGTRVEVGIFKITFFTNEYFTKRGILSFYPFVEVRFLHELVSPPADPVRLLTPTALPTADSFRGQVGGRALPVSYSTKL